MMSYDYDSYPVCLSDKLFQILQYNAPFELWDAIFDGLRDVVRCYEIRGQDDLLEKEVLKLRDAISLVR
jgi:hypothetical protein